MLRRTTLLPVALAAALAAAAPGVARAAAPVAHAAGGDPPPTIPSIIQTRITRTENALDRLTQAVDDGDTAAVTRTGKTIRRQMAAAWRGAVWYLKNPPPPPAGDLARAPAKGRSVPAKAAAKHRKARARAADDPTVPLIADPPTAMLAVFQLQHEVAATIAELTDGARVPVLNAMSLTLFFSLDRRDKAIATAHSLEPPPDPEGGEDATATIATAMPQVVPMLDDEMQQIRALQSDATDLRPGGKTILRAALVQTVLTELTINTIWPPVIGD
jgi:hypothetical protein